MMGLGLLKRIVIFTVKRVSWRIACIVQKAQGFVKGAKKGFYCIRRFVLLVLVINYHQIVLVGH